MKTCNPAQHSLYVCVSVPLYLSLFRPRTVHTRLAAISTTNFANTRKKIEKGNRNFEYLLCHVSTGTKIVIIVIIIIIKRLMLEAGWWASGECAHTIENNNNNNRYDDRPLPMYILTHTLEHTRTRILSRTFVHRFNYKQ